MSARLLPLTAVIVASALATPAQATCVAEPGRAGRTLAWCLSQGDPDIALKEGDHYAGDLVLPSGVTLRPVEGARSRPLVRTTSPGLAEWLVSFLSNKETAYLTSQQPSFYVQGNREPVVVRGLRFAPLTVDADWAGLGTITVGRVFQVHDAELVVEDCVLGPVDFFPADGDPTPQYMVLRNDVDPDTADVSGGVLAHVSGASTLTLKEVDVSGIYGPSVEGAAVYATGGDVDVQVIGGTFHDSVVGFGLLAAHEGAGLYVLAESNAPVPEFWSLVGQLGGAVFAADGGVVELYGGVYRDNGIPADLADAAVRQNGGAHAAADRDGVLRIWDGEFYRGNAGFGGVAAVRNASLEVFGGNYGSSTSEHNRARVGGLFALYEDDNLPGEPPVALFADVTLQAGVAARNKPEEAAYGGDASQPDGNVNDDYATAGGAIAAIGGSVTLERTTISGSQAAGGLGGGVFIMDGELSIEGGRIGGNAAVGGAGICALQAQVDASGMQLVSNGDAERTLRGGGLFAWESSVSFSDSSLIDGNQAAIGGGLDVSGDVSIDINASRVSNNIAADGEGGGIRSEVARLELFGATFTANQASTKGGAVAAVAAYEPADGSRLYGSLEITETGIGSGQATWGGGVYASDVDVTVYASDIVENDAISGGGGMIAVGRSVLVERGSVIALNAAGEAGGGLLLDGSTLTLKHGLITGNEAPLASAMLLQNGGGHVVRSNRICANRASNQSSVVFDSPAGPSVFAHNMVDEEDVDHPVLAVSGSLDVGYNHFKQDESPAFTTTGAAVSFHHNVVAYSESGQAAIATTATGPMDLSDNVIWGLHDPLPRVAVQLEVSDDGLYSVGEPKGTWEVDEADYQAVDPRLRGWADGAIPRGLCAIEDHHPRPDSPLIVDYQPGMEFDGSAGHLGIFGGEFIGMHPTAAWTADLDADGIPRIFDCDEGDVDFGDHLEQWVDLDGDGVGGEADATYSCELLPGNTLVPGDCDDADFSVDEDCPQDPVTFYGSQCSSLGVGSTGGLCLAGLLVLLRRRRHALAQMT